MTASTYISFALGLITNAIIARELGPKEYGLYAYVVWLSGILVMIATNGLTTTSIRFISEGLGRGNAEAAAQAHGWLLRLQQICVAVVAIGFLAAITLALPPGWHDGTLVFAAVVIVSFATKSFYLFDVSVAKGYAQYSVEAFTTVAISTANIVGVLALYATDQGLMPYFILFAVTSAVHPLVAWGMLRSRGIRSGPRLIEDPTFSSRLKNHLVWTVLLAIAAALGNKSSETYLLNEYAGPQDVGFYLIAAGLTRGGVELLSSGLNTVLMPLMGYAFGAGGEERVSAILANAVRHFTFAGLLLAGVGVMWADVTITLIYGAPFHPAVLIFRVMSVVAGLTMSLGAFGALLSTTDNQRVRAFAALMSLVLSVLAAVLLVPRFGLVGAVVAHAVSSAIIFLGISAKVVQTFSVKLPWRELSRMALAALIASAVAGTCLYLSHGLLLQFVGGVLYVVTFLGASVLLKAWTAEDGDLLTSLAHRYPGLFGQLLLAFVRRIRH